MKHIKQSTLAAVTHQTQSQASCFEGVVLTAQSFKSYFDRFPRRPRKVLSIYLIFCISSQCFFLNII